MKGRERSSTPGESLPHLDPPAHWELSQAPHDFHLRPLEEGEGLGSPTLSFIFNKVPLKKEEKKKRRKKKKKEKKKGRKILSKLSMELGQDSNQNWKRE